jgi:hypothetical protein
MTYDILIFIQACADLRHALNIYDQNRGKKFHICVVNVKMIYDYTVTLSLENTQLDFLPILEINYKNPFNYIYTKRKLKEISLDNFEKNSYHQVYFFSRFYDWLTANMIGTIIRSQQSDVFYYEHYDDASVKNDITLSHVNLKYIKLKYIAKVVTYVSEMNFIARYSIRNLEFNYHKYPIIKVSQHLTPYVNPIFKYDILNVEGKKNIIVFLSPDEISMLVKTSGNTLRIIFQLFKERGYHLILKGHPRLGSPVEFDDSFDQRIPEYIPSEFISYLNVDFAIGIISTSLNFAVEIAGLKVISIARLVEFRDTEKQLFYENYLMELSRRRINFVDNLDDLVSIVL